MQKEIYSEIIKGFDKSGSITKCEGRVSKIKTRRVDNNSASFLTEMNIEPANLNLARNE